jgi:hypothetical protein
MGHTDRFACCAICGLYDIEENIDICHLCKRPVCLDCSRKTKDLTTCKNTILCKSGKSKQQFMQASAPSRNTAPVREKKKSTRGFASMTPEKRRGIASKGGKAAQALGTAHKWTSEEAQYAGHKGGLAYRKKPSEEEDE